MAKKRIVVIGAGPAGLTAALQLIRGGQEVILIEAAPHHGGLCHSFRLWDCTVDVGPHRFFSMEPSINKMWFEMAGESKDNVQRLTRILYRNRFFNYPIRPVNALRNLGVIDAARCVLSYGYRMVADWGRPEVDFDDSFETWVSHRFGNRLYEIFFRAYTEKLWGIPCTELESDFAAQRIKKLSLGTAIWNALFPKKKAHRTLVDEFAYPHGGACAVYDAMLDKFQKAGGQYMTRTKVVGVMTEGGKVKAARLENGNVIECDFLVSSMPLSHLISGFDDVPPAVKRASDSLQYRNTVLTYLKVDATDLFPDQWIYVHSPELKIGRVTNFRNWTPHLYGDAKFSILCCEMWDNDSADSLIHQPDEEIAKLATREIVSSKLCLASQISDAHVLKIKNSYPIYYRGYQQHVDAIADFLRSFPNIQAIGRYGAFKYNNQDHSILMGLLAAENILDGANHDLWTVNSDKETYQESGRSESAKQGS